MCWNNLKNYLCCTDLPCISTKPISEDIISKYVLKKISDTINLYSSVIDLNNTSEDVYNENKQEKSDEELKKSVLLSNRFARSLTDQ